MNSRAATHKDIEKSRLDDSVSQPTLPPTKAHTPQSLQRMSASIPFEALTTAAHKRTTFPPTIHGAADRILSAFEQVKLGAGDADNAQRGAFVKVSQIQFEEGRFRIWCAYNGVPTRDTRHVRGDNTIEYRLKDADSLRNILLGLLEDVMWSLQNVLGIISGRRMLPGERMSFIETHNFSQRPRASKCTDTAGQVRYSVEVMVKTIDFMFLKGLETRAPEATTFVSRVKVSDPETAEPQDIEMILELWPKLEKSMIERIARANTARRIYLEYRHKHYAQCERATGYPRTPEEAAFAAVVSHPSRLHQPSAIVIDLEEAEPDGEDEEKKVKAKLKELFTDTDICPENAFKRPFECRLCHLMVKVRTPYLWSEHVFADLSAYTCTSLKCSTSDTRYPSRLAWITHEMLAHGSTYQCLLPSSSKTSFSTPAKSTTDAWDRILNLGSCEIFASQKELEEHIADTHPEPEIPGRGKWLDCLDTFEEGGRHFTHRIEADWVTKACAFCGEGLESLEDWGKHVGAHMESLALLALRPLTKAKTGGTGSAGTASACCPADAREKSAVDDGEEVASAADQELV